MRLTNSNVILSFYTKVYWDNPMLYMSSRIVDGIQYMNQQRQNEKKENATSYLFHYRAKEPLNQVECFLSLENTRTV